MIEFDLDKIKPYKLNQKEHSSKQIDNIINSIKEFGFNQPIVVDKNNEIIVGHGRFEAAKKLGYKKIPVIIKDNLTEEQVRAYRLADNKLNESKWKYNLVIKELLNLDSKKYDISITGFSKKILNKNLNFPEIKITNIYQVVIECKNEKEQEKIFNKLKKDGLKCKLLTI